MHRDLSRPLVIVDGAQFCLDDYDARIEHVLVPWGESVYLTLDRGESAIITSVLVVPPELPWGTQDLGTLAIGRTDYLRPPFEAPVLALADRYHGLKTLAQVKQRMRLVLGVDVEDWVGDETFLGALPKPLRVVECLEWAIVHRASSVVPPPVDVLRVEIQALVSVERRPRPQFFAFQGRAARP
jgi:hypothetical protein